MIGAMFEQRLELRKGRVTATVDRRDKWAAQTPQMFRLGLVEQALTTMGGAATDEASAVEALGLAPLLVRASMANFKVTWPEDFDLAAHWVHQVGPSSR